MTHRIGFIAILGLLAGGALLSTLGTPDNEVTLASLGDVWADAMRDVDQVGMQVTRLSDDEEMRVGDELAQHANFGPADLRSEAYVQTVARPLLANLRRPRIRYRFHVVESDEINAFALPGGHIFVMTGLLKFVENEAQLTAVLGHEISHIDLRHCVEHYQYQYQLKQAGMPTVGWLVELAHRLATINFSSVQELEADAHGESLNVQAGYDPDAAAVLFFHMRQEFGEPDSVQPATPAGELRHALGKSIAAYFRSHPPSAERAQKLEALTAQHERDLQGRQFYRGVRNLKARVPRVSKEYPEEFRTY